MISGFKASKLRAANFLDVYISQNAHLFQEQPKVACIITEFASAGGRKTGSLYFMGVKNNFIDFKDLLLTSEIKLYIHLKYQRKRIN